MPPGWGGCVVFLLLAVMPLGGCVPSSWFVCSVLLLFRRFLFVRLLFVFRVGILGSLLCTCVLLRLV